MNLHPARRIRTLSLLAALGAVAAPPAQAGYVFQFEQHGTVAPSDALACGNPFLGCELTAIGTVTALSGGFGPWQARSEFHLVLPPTGPVYRTVGTFFWDDTSAADNDLFGTTLGSFDAATFTNHMTYTLTGGTGDFAGLTGMAETRIQIFPGALPPFGYVEIGLMQVPEPATASLAALALLLGAGRLRRRPMA